MGNERFMFALKLARCPALTHVLPPFRPVGLPIYVARVPAAPFARCYPFPFTLITRTARARASYLAALPSTRAMSRSRRVLCLPRRSVGEGGSLHTSSFIVLKRC